jgi:hypothetical protein
MNNIKKLPPAFLQARLDLINRELSQLPRTWIGTHRNSKVIRNYHGETQSEHLISSNKGQLLLFQHERRHALLVIKEQLESILSSCSETASLDPNKVPPLMGEEFWNKLESSSNNHELESDYSYKGVAMRSRGEVIIAQVLDSLGLLYKYEPMITIDGKNYCPDFIVYLPELKRCFVIEFIGMIDDFNYAMSNTTKLMSYLKVGMVINKDLLIFSGTRRSMTSPDEIKADIIALINKLCNILTVA